MCSTIPRLAASLEQIARGGRDAFYKGPIAQGDCRTTCSAATALLTAADLAANQPDWVEPMSTNYRGYDVLELPPNTQGIVDARDAQHPRGLRPEVAAATTPPRTCICSSKPSGWRLPIATRGWRRRLGRRETRCSGCCRRTMPRHAGASSIRSTRPRVQAAVTAGFFAGARGTSTGARRHHLHDRRGSRGQCRLADPIAVRGLRLRHRRGRHRHRAAQPRRLFTLEAGHPNQIAPGKRPFHTLVPAMVHERRSPVALLRRDGRRHAAAGARPGAAQPDRLRHEHPGGGRSAALPAHRQRSRARVRHLSGGTVRPRPARPLDRHADRSVRRLPGHPVRPAARA